MPRQRPKGQGNKGESFGWEMGDPAGRDGKSRPQNLLGLSWGPPACMQQSGWEENKPWDVASRAGESLRFRTVCMVVKCLLG